MTSGSGTARHSSSKVFTAFGWKRRNRDTSKIFSRSAQVDPSFARAAVRLPRCLVAAAVLFVRLASSAWNQQARLSSLIS